MSFLLALALAVANLLASPQPRRGRHAPPQDGFHIIYDGDDWEAAIRALVARL